MLRLRSPRRSVSDFLAARVTGRRDSPLNTGEHRETHDRIESLEAPMLTKVNAIASEVRTDPRAKVEDAPRIRVSLPLVAAAFLAMSSESIGQVVCTAADFGPQDPLTISASLT